MIVEERKTNRPSFQFYPNDWLTDHSLQSCSLEAQGLWINLMCLMHSGVPYGHLCDSSGKPLTEEQIRRLLHGIDKRKFRRLLSELGAKSVLSLGDFGATSGRLQGEVGAIFSRRMVRDEEKRLKQSDFGRKGGNPTLKAPSKELWPSSSSSSPSRTIGVNPPKAKFEKPTKQQIQVYCVERKNTVDAQKFFDHYEARGWKYNGGLAMKDWKAAVRTWEGRSGFNANQPAPAQKVNAASNKSWAQVKAEMDGVPQ